MAVGRSTYGEAKAALVALEEECMRFPGFMLSQKVFYDIREARENAEHLHARRKHRRALATLKKEHTALTQVLQAISRKKLEIFSRRRKWILMSGIPDREMNLFISALQELALVVETNPFDLGRARTLITELHRIKRMCAHARREFPLSIRAWRLAKWQAWHRSGSRSWVPYLGTRSGIVT